jgi:SAM-dependent methyltransferase
LKLRLYSDLATWWPLVSPPEGDLEQAQFLFQLLTHALGRRPGGVLELGSGGGGVASHLAPHVGSLTLVDIAPEMLEVSKRVNPSAEHVAGDMRAVRLGKKFDAVVLQQAVMYMATPEDLRAAFETAREHVETDGIVVVVPDFVEETFQPSTGVGGRDDPSSGHGLRYLEWRHTPREGESHVTADFAIIARRADGATTLVHDRHVWGLFSRDAWKQALVDAGFPIVQLVDDPWKRDVFLARPGI